MPSCRWLCNYFIVDTFYAYVALAEAATDRGSVRVAATSRGVAAVALPDDDETFLASLARRGLVPDRHRAGAGASELAGAAAADVVRLLAGEDPDAGRLPLDLGDRPAWDRLVLEAVRAIPRGSTASYGEVARRIGRAGAARAVGGAVGRNPVGLLVPCHRVVAGDGTLGGYGVAAWGGLDAALDLKAELLSLEGVVIRRSARVSGR